MKKRLLPFLIMFLLLFAKSLTGQGIHIGFGWGLINFQNSVVEKEGSNLLEYKIEGDYRYGFVLKYKLPNKNLRFTSLYYVSDINGDGNLREDPSRNIIEADVDTENSLSTFGVGLEYLLTEKPFIYYAGLNFLIGRFSDVKISYKDKSSQVIRDTFSSKTRLGLGANAGISVAMFPGMDMDINLSYGSLNLLGKKGYENQISSVDLTVTILFLL